MPGSRCVILPQMCSLTSSAKLPDGGDQAFFARLNQRLIDGWRNLAGDRVANAYCVGAGVDLNPGKLDGDIDAQVHQFGGERRIFQEIDQQRGDAAQVGRLGRRPFNPAEDRVLTTILRPVGADGFNAVAHAYASQRVRAPKAHQVLRICQRRRGAWHAVTDVGYVGTEPLGLSIRIRNATQLIEAEVTRTRGIGLHKRAIIGRERAVVRRNVLGGKPHQDRRARHKVGHAPTQHCEISFQAIHGCKT